MRRLILATTVVSLLLLCTAEAVACPICVPYPKTTLADALLESQSVVMVREDGARPYVFLPVEVLKGSVDGPAIDGFIDSTSRRRLKRNPEDLAVFVRDSAGGAWSYRCYASADNQGFIRAIFEQSTAWTGEDGGDRRIAFFTGYLTDSDPLIRNQAYLEVGRAPYSTIKAIAGAVPRDQIFELLTNWRLIEWHSLFILMLGQSQLPSDHALIRSEFERRARYGNAMNLSAWVTAYIETNPEGGIEDVEALYLSRGGRTPAELEEIHRSLSVLGSEGGAVAEPRLARRRRRIVESYGILLEHHPAMAGNVARDLTSWRTRALVDQLAGIMESEIALDPISKMAVEYYLSMAPRYRSNR